MGMPATGKSVDVQLIDIVRFAADMVDRTVAKAADQVGLDAFKSRIAGHHAGVTDLRPDHGPGVACPIVAAIPTLGLGAVGYLAFAWLNGLTAGI